MATELIHNTTTSENIMFWVYFILVQKEQPPNARA